MTDDDSRAWGQPRLGASMKTALRTALGWIAAVLVNLGMLLFAAGLLVPRTDASPALGAGIGTLAAGALGGSVDTERTRVGAYGDDRRHQGQDDGTSPPKSRSSGKVPASVCLVADDPTTHKRTRRQPRR